MNFSIAAVLQMIAVMSMAGAEKEPDSVIGFLNISDLLTQQKCERSTEVDIRTGKAVTLCTTACGFFVLAAMWSGAVMCVTKRHFKQQDKLTESEINTKMLLRIHRPNHDANDLDLAWSDRFFSTVNSASGPTSSSSRRQSSFVNDSIINMMG